MWPERSPSVRDNRRPWRGGSPHFPVAGSPVLQRVSGSIAVTHVEGVVSGGQSEGGRRGPLQARVAQYIDGSRREAVSGIEFGREESMQTGGVVEVAAGLLRVEEAARFLAL